MWEKERGRGFLVVLVGETFSVVGEALDYYQRKYGENPSHIYLIPTEGTKLFAELSKLVLQEKFREIKVSTEVFPKNDITSEEDFSEFACHVASVIRNALQRSSRGIVSITGGRKVMSVAAYIVASHMFMKVIDTRSETAEEDRVYIAQIKQKLKESEDAIFVYESYKDIVNDLTLRKADIVYELPRVRIEEEESYEKISECVKVM